MEHIDRKANRYTAGMMLLPVLLLGGVGFLLRGHEGIRLKVPSHRFALVVADTQIEPVTPEEVADGYSCKVKVVLTHDGPTPQWWDAKTLAGSLNHTFIIDPLAPGATRRHAKLGAWRIGAALCYKQNGTLKMFQKPDGSTGIPMGSPNYDEKTGCYISEFKCPVDAVPSANGQVIFKGVFGVNLDNAVPVSIIVRQDKEKVQPVDISTASGISLQSVKVERLSPTESKNYDGFDTRVRVVAKYQGTNANIEWQGGAAFLVDEKGKIYSFFKTPRGESSYNFEEGPTDKVNKLKQWAFVFPIAQVPRQAGQIKFKTKVSANHAWPLQVSVVVRPAEAAKASRHQP